MKYRIYTTSKKAWDAMLKSIVGATKSIYIEMYIFLGDTYVTHDFLGILKNKALGGVEVVIILDAYGSKDLRQAEIAELREAGVELIFFSHWLRHTHRKFLIVDNQVAFLGGVNIENKIINWRDVQIKIQGRIIKPILKSFAYAYKMSGGHKASILQYNNHSFTKKLKGWLIDNWSNTQHSYYLNNYYRQKIIEAQKSIQIVTPYLLPPRWLLALLDNAVRRGVDVEIILPQDTDIKPINRINYLNACRLSAMGVKFYFFPSMNHAKLMLVDQEEGIIGSQNLDVLSFGFNMEAGIFFRQKDMIHDLSHLIERWKKESELFQSGLKKISFGNKVLIAIFKIFYPIF
jgi:cardiolipin synthase